MARIRAKNWHASRLGNWSRRLGPIFGWLAVGVLVAVCLLFAAVFLWMLSAPTSA